MLVVVLRRRGLQALVSLVMAMVVTLLFAVPSRAADPVAPPSVSSSDWAKWKAQLSSRTQAARMPLRALASKVGGSATSVTAARARSAVAAKSVAESRFSSSVASGRVAVPTTAKNVATKVGGKMLGGAGKGLTGVFVFNLTYELGTSAMGGMFGLESNGFMCDVKMIGGDDSCAVSGAEGYVANSDVSASQPGFGMTPVWDYQVYARMTAGGAVTYMGDVAVEVVAETDTSVTFRESFSGTVANVSEWHQDVGYSLWCRGDTGTLWSQGYKSSRIYAHSTNGSITTSEWTQSCSVGYVVDHVLVNWNAIDTVRYVPALHTPQSEFAKYFGLTTADRPPLVVENPLRVWRTTYSCEQADGGTIVGSSDSVEFSELDEVWPEFPEVACATGDLVELHVDQITEGVVPLRVYEWVLPEEAAAWSAEYPQCAEGSCTLELERRDETTGRYLACFDSPDLCTDWFADPAKTENFQCTYAGDVLDLSECNLYAPTFTQTLGGGLADPLTGEKVDTTPGGLGTAPTDPTLTVPGGSLWGSNSRPGNCPPPFEWNSLINPWWYYQGVKCALYEAFVPAEPSAPFIALAEYWNGTRLGAMFASWNGVMDGLQVGGTDCRGPGGVLGTTAFGLDGVEFYPLSSCTGWAATWAPLVKTSATWFAGWMFSYGMLKTVSRGFGHEMDER